MNWQRAPRKSVLVADDNTRLTPTDKIIPILLNELNAAGIKDEQVTVIIALGTHRPMRKEEILAKYGQEVVRRVTVKNHNFRDPELMVDLGTTPNGTHIKVNREAYEADFKIGIGSIVPHYIPGFAGGAKNSATGDFCRADNGGNTSAKYLRTPFIFGNPG